VVTYMIFTYKDARSHEHKKIDWIIFTILINLLTYFEVVT